MANTRTISAATATTTVELFSTPVTGEVWTIILDDDQTRTTISHVVEAGESAAALAAAITDAINSRAPDAFIATRVPTDTGNLLVIVNRTGRSFATTMAVTTAGNVTVLESERIRRPEEGNRYFYGPVNPNVRVDEAEQVDVLNVFNGNSPADNKGKLTENSLTGLGMGTDTVISGRELPGGIQYFDVETLNIQLGTGNDSFTIESTHRGATN